MKTLAIAASIAALSAFPLAAQAESKHHKGMEGSPNAAGFKGKQGAGGQESAGDKDNPAGGGKMKGPPNADGYKK